METEPKLHRSNNCSRPIFGFELEAGDVLEPTDMYDSTSGDWQACPAPGLVIQHGNCTKWVRPDKTK